MYVLSIDVGIKNLSYILVKIGKLRPKPEFSILAWNNVNIMHSFDDLNYVCTEYTKWDRPTLVSCIEHLGLSEETAGASATTTATNKPIKQTKAMFQDKIKVFLKSKKIKKTPRDLQKVVQNVARHFDSFFDPTKCDAVIIENQPCMKNPEMKSMQMIVFTYFCLFPNASYPVKCVSASQKMKFCKNRGWIEKIPKGDYKETKRLSVEVATKLINDRPEPPPESWTTSKKKDDLSDVLIQAFAYCDKLV